MKRKGFLLTLSLLSLLFLATNAIGATAVNGSVYSINDQFAPSFTVSDRYFMAAYLFVDSNASDVYVQNIPGSSGDHQLAYFPGWDWVWPSNHLFVNPVTSLSPGSVWTDRTYTFYVDENGNGALDFGEATLDHFVTKNSISQLDVVQNVTISDGANPVIEWDNVAHPYEYRIEIYPIVANNPNIPNVLFRSATIKATESRYSYQYMGDLFKAGDPLAIVIQANEYQPDGNVLNRSRYFAEHVVPIPGAIWLLGSGLIALVGIRRRFKN